MKRTLLTALLAFPLLSAVAAERYSESFSAPEGEVPSGWVVKKIGQDSIAEVRPIDGARVSHALLVERPGPASTNASVFFTGAANAPTDGRVADFSLTVTFRISGNRVATSSSRGVVFRAAAQSYNNFHGYYAAVHQAGDRRGVAIYSNPTTHIENGEEIASATFASDLDPETDYILQVTAKGSTVEAAVYKTTSSGAKGEELGTARTDTATNTDAGYIGLRGAYGNSGPVGTWFHSLHLTTQE